MFRGTALLFNLKQYLMCHLLNIFHLRLVPAALINVLLLVRIRSFFSSLLLFFNLSLWSDVFPSTCKEALATLTLNCLRNLIRIYENIQNTLINLKTIYYFEVDSRIRFRYLKNILILRCFNVFHIECPQTNSYNRHSFIQNYNKDILYAIDVKNLCC